MIRLLIVDDHQVVRIGLISLLQLRPNIEIVGEAGSQKEAIEKALKFKPDVILMDVKLTMQGDSIEETGIMACQKIKDLLPETKIIMLSSFSDDDLIYESIMVGASGYLLKGVDGQELIRSIEMVAEGKSLLDPSITAKVFQRMKMISKQQAFLQDLTQQEKEVLKLLAKGLSNKEIANEMNLVEKTVRNYVSHILAKLGVSNRVQASSLVMKNKLFGE